MLTIFADPLWFWLLLLGGGALTIDLIAHRKIHTIELLEASLWSLFYIGVAVLYGLIVWEYGGSELATLYFTGFILEKALSVDNLFVFGVIFSLFGIHPRYQHKILRLGVLGAIVFRAVFVFLGVSFLDAAGGWAMLVFAVMLTWATVSLLRGVGDDDIAESWYYRFANKLMPIDRYAFPHEFTFKKHVTSERCPNGCWQRYATVALPCLVTIELADVMFAFDSVPAVIAVSEKPIIIYSSMVMAILGLRALYFVLEAVKRALPLLERAMILILAFIACKMFLHAYWELMPEHMERANLMVYKWFGTPWLDLYVEPHESLAVIAGLLAGAMALSPFVKDEDDVDETTAV